MENTAVWIALAAVFVALMPVIVRGLGQRDGKKTKGDGGGSGYTASDSGTSRKAQADDAQDGSSDTGASGGWGSDGGGGDGGGGGGD